jgi:hypothetical protein
MGIIQHRAYIALFELDRITGVVLGREDDSEGDQNLLELLDQQGKVLRAADGVDLHDLHWVLFTVPLLEARRRLEEKGVRCLGK